MGLAFLFCQGGFYEHAKYRNCDGVESMRAIVKYVAGLGHRRLAFIHGQEGDVTRMRLAGFYRGCRDCGLAVPEDMAIPARYHEPEDCEKAVKALMSLPAPKRPTCLLLPDDIGYLGASTALEAMGLSVPEDVSCFGYDGIHMTKVLRPSLATYEQDAKEIGRVAAEELLHTIEEPKTFAAETIVIPGRIRPGGTVKALAAEG